MSDAAAYFRASRAARRAWEATSQQLQIDGVLEEAGEPSGSFGACAGRVPSAAAPASSSAPSDGSPRTGTPPLRPCGSSGALDIGETL